MVEKLYVEDPYARTCEAEVTTRGDGYVCLDRTVFFPEGGGQVGDTGWTGDHRVIDTQRRYGHPFSRPDFPLIKVEGEIVHFLAAGDPGPEAGEQLTVTLDWERRYRIMRLHSAAHLAYHYTFAVFGEMEVKGCRIDDGRARFDFRTSEPLDRQLLEKVEVEANAIVDEGLPIVNVALPEHPEALMWHCGDIVMPCGGTHVASSGEIGHFRLRRKGQGKGLERLYIEPIDGV